MKYTQVRNINIDDLLDRQTVGLHADYIKAEVQGKVVLVTGAAGSIGSELVRQITRFAPGKLILVDQAESPLVDLHLELTESFRYANAVPVLADIISAARMAHVFRQYKPDIVYHAAAYKHVPLLESHPNEAVKVNVHGTKLLADLAVQYKVGKFVLISTDKAVNPGSVMGASKRIAEIYIQSLNNKQDKTAATRFITTRFGNVLGSTGSVLPRFIRQIEAGGPLTVTSPAMYRYFMTISEACQLVLEAGAMGKGGEIYIFDMGKPIRILDLAEKLVRMAGLQPYADIPILFTGLRPGEKTEEELLCGSENLIPTHHEKIMIAQVRAYDFSEVNDKIEELLLVLDSQDDQLILNKMKEVEPEGSFLA